MTDGSGRGPGGSRRAAGQLEAAILAVLHQAGGPLTPRAVRDRLGGGLAYSTVVTILSRLHAKGVLDRVRTGRAYRYFPVTDEPGLAARRMASVLAAEPDRQAVLARFVSALCAADEQLLRRMLDAGEYPVGRAAATDPRGPGRRARGDRVDGGGAGRDNP